jgi:hypothetical protein
MMHWRRTGGAGPSRLERVMSRTTSHRLIRLALLATALAFPAVALAGGGHGSNGDSSNNPFTGDSYAYFHGGRNEGQGAMILPGRAYGPPPTGIQLYPPAGRDVGRSSGEANRVDANSAATSSGDASSAADTRRGGATRSFRPSQGPDADASAPPGQPARPAP